MRLDQSATVALFVLAAVPSIQAMQAATLDETLKPNRVEIGVGHVSESDDRFGRYKRTGRQWLFLLYSA